MGELYVIDTTSTVADIEQILNDLAEIQWSETKENLLFTIPPGGPNKGRLAVLTIPGTRKPVAGAIKVAAFPLTLDADEVAGELAKLEQSENLETRLYGQTVVESNLQWLAILDKNVVASSVAPGKFLRLEGRISNFGGPDDHGMTQMEDTAFVWDANSEKDYPGFFLPYDPAKPTGYGRRLRTDKHYIACRWEELGTPLPRKYLRQPTTMCSVINPVTGVRVDDVRPIDFGPHDSLNRVADLSPSVEKACGLVTDQVAVILIPLPGGQDAKIPASEKPPAVAPNGTRRATWLTGSYAQRRELAGKLGCTYTIDFHFNSADVPAFGPEVYYQAGDAKAKALGQAILDSMLALGLPNTRAENLQPAKGTRAGYIEGYPCPSVLLEPLFIFPDPGQAAWIKNPDNLRKLAEHVAQAVYAQTTPSDLIGLSIGHLGNTANPGDRGAEARGGGWETDFSEPMAKIVYRTLTGLPA
jgi:hypothetical protein